MTATRHPPAPIDTAPPAVPANLERGVQPHGGDPVSWDMNTVDTDLAGYVVSRNTTASAETLVTAPAG